MRFSYVEDRLEHNDIFNAKDILEREPSREGRLKYWNNELCRTKPQTFDFVVTVCRLRWTGRRWLTSDSLGVMAPSFTQAGSFNVSCHQYSPLHLALSVSLPNSILQTTNPSSRNHTEKALWLAYGSASSAPSCAPVLKAPAASAISLKSSSERPKTTIHTRRMATSRF